MKGLLEDFLRGFGFGFGFGWVWSFMMGFGLLRVLFKGWNGFYDGFLSLGWVKVDLGLRRW